VHTPILPRLHWPSSRSGKLLASPTTPLNQLLAGVPFRRFVRSLSLRPSWLLALCADPTKMVPCPPRPSRAFTSGLPVPEELPDITTAPHGNLRRRDFHPQVQQLASLRRFLGTMGPSDSLETCMSAVRQCLRGPSRALRRGSFQGLPVSVQRVSTHAQGLRLRGVHGRLAMIVAHDVAFPTSEQGRHAEGLISELNGWPACASVNASPATLPPPAHDSRLERFATPFLCGSFIRDSLPVYPGAFTCPVFSP